jgi:hypothetical protein
VNGSGIKAVLLTGVYGSGKSTVAKEMAYLPEQAGEPAVRSGLSELGGAGEVCRTSCSLTLSELPPRYKPLSRPLAAPVKVVRLTADLPVIQQRLAGDVTTGRR